MTRTRMRLFDAGIECVCVCAQVCNIIIIIILVERTRARGGRPVVAPVGTQMVFGRVPMVRVRVRARAGIRYK